MCFTFLSQLRVLSNLQFVGNIAYCTSRERRRYNVKLQRNKFHDIFHIDEIYIREVSRKRFNFASALMCMLVLMTKYLIMKAKKMSSFIVEISQPLIFDGVLLSTPTSCTLIVCCDSFYIENSICTQSFHQSFIIIVKLCRCWCFFFVWNQISCNESDLDRDMPHMLDKC